MLARQSPTSLVIQLSNSLSFVLNFIFFVSEITAFVVTQVAVPLGSDYFGSLKSSHAFKAVFRYALIGQFFCTSRFLFAQWLETLQAWWTEAARRLFAFELATPCWQEPL